MSKESMKLALEAETLKQMLWYDPETGIFRWRVSSSRNVKPWDVAGMKGGEGYWHIRINGKAHRAHRLAWLYMTGRWPDRLIDHINGVRNDNRFQNIRQADDFLNSQNQRVACSNSKTGLLGVFHDKKRANKPFYSTIGANKKKIWLGRFETAEQAHQAYVNAKRELHQGCAI